MERIVKPICESPASGVAPMARLAGVDSFVIGFGRPGKTLTISDFA